MRHIELEDIAGLWRSEDDLIQLELGIRPDKESYFTMLHKKGNVRISGEQGKCELKKNESDWSLWIDDRVELVIWRLDSEKGELILDYNKGRHLFHRIDKKKEN